jgi:Family of unknown function (DUF5318)
MSLAKIRSMKLAPDPDTGGSLTKVTVTSRPGASRYPDGQANEARVEYRLVRNAVVRDVRNGKLQRTDVCDAHPELMRAARNIGRPTDEDCPICESSPMVAVTFVFGAGLPPGGRCPGTLRELQRLQRRPEPVVCYEVEACPECAWHHLMRRYPAGGRAPKRRATGGS